MPEPTVPPVVPPVPDPSPGPKPDEKPAKTYTEAEHKEALDRKMQGPGKELKRAQAEAEKYRKQVEDHEKANMSEVQKLQADNKVLAEEVVEGRAAIESNKQRLAGVAERNAERIKNLPDKESKNDAKGWEAEMSPDQFSRWLSQKEREVVTRDVAHARGVKPSVGERTEEEHQAFMERWGQHVTDGKEFKEGGQG